MLIEVRLSAEPPRKEILMAKKKAKAKKKKK